MGIDFGAQLLGQRRSARREDIGLGNARLLFIEVSGRIPLSIFSALVVTVCFVFLHVEWFYTVYVLAYIGASPFAVNWLFLGLNKAHVPAVWAGFKTMVSLSLFLFPNGENGAIIAVLGIVYFACTFGVLVSGVISQRGRLGMLFSLRSFYPVRIIRFIKRRYYIGSLSLIESLINFIPYFVINTFASNSEFLAQFYFIDRISRGLVQVYQPISLYLISHLPMREVLDRRLSTLWPLLAAMGTILIIVSAMLTGVYGLYFVDLFTNKIGLSWILFGLLLAHAIVSAIGGIVSVLFVFNLGYDKMFVKGQILGLLALVIIVVGTPITGSIYFVATGMVLAKTFITLYYTIRGAIPYLKVWKKRVM